MLEDGCSILDRFSEGWKASISDVKMVKNKHIAQSVGFHHFACYCCWLKINRAKPRVTDWGLITGSQWSDQ